MPAEPDLVAERTSPITPPRNAPTIPTASVGRQPIAWRPGVTQRATSPATNPKRMIETMPTRRPYWRTCPVTQPGPNGSVGGCGADLPRNIAIVAGLSSLGLPCRRRRGRRRACSAPSPRSRRGT